DSATALASSETRPGSRSRSAPAATSRGVGCEGGRPKALHVGSASTTAPADSPGAVDTALATLPSPSTPAVGPRPCRHYRSGPCGAPWGYGCGSCGLLALGRARSPRHTWVGAA